MSSVHPSAARPGWKSAAEAALNAAWSIRRPQYANRIIYYHSLHPELDMSHRPDAFRRQLEWLKEHGYHDVRVSQLSDKAVLREPWVAITFDDGYRDNLEFAAPILEEIGLTATFFVVAGMVRDGKRATSDDGHKLYPGRQMLSTGDVRALAQSGFEIGSHSLDHNNAADAAKASYTAYVRSLISSKEILEMATQRRVGTFAYPNGQRGAFSDTSRNAIGEAGFDVAATTLWGAVPRTPDLLQVPRCEMSAGDSREDFVAKMTGRRDYRFAYQRLVNGSKAW